MCEAVFIPKSSDWIATAYVDYALHKQTYAELSVTLRRDRKTVQKYLTEYNHITGEIPTLKKADRICVVIDATYFWSRNDGLALIRTNTGLNLAYEFVSSESLESMSGIVDVFNAARYNEHTDAFTIDGRRFMFSLLEQRYPSIPIQMCIFHMKAIIRRYTTLRPKTRLGRALKILKTILGRIPGKMFNRLFYRIEVLYADFIQERNYSGNYEHKKLRSALASIRYYLPYLHVYEQYPYLSIPRTTGVCDGYFSHLKEKLKPHRWISRIHRNSLLIFLLEEHNRKARNWV